ncbi:LacI family transcriptional regulator [Marinococcus halophilus]|uniref:LacI family transcriptional regulator n=1 Tax=Marinococcus halophilus TaxID=1371 RepID=A0A510YB73_MARHA|nr:LacI family DNA-binding transcriptional regulator [Marinococcus halophilus]OZT79116.1 LacI family transcriptional regulator [Marinococcus halophilus]GEK59901.1 LacI family transcriptional regulator [Marinococcus halophilus]
MKPKIQDVAKAAGVSPTTVSRVLNNRGYISQSTKDKVYHAMEMINYIPNDLARSLYNQKTNLIGVIVPSTSNPFYGELVAEIEHACNTKGYKVLLCNSLHEADKEQEYWDMLQRNQVDGVIVVTYNRGVVPKNHSAPAVAIDHYISSHMHVVSSDNYKGGEAATQELLTQGCQKPIHINGPLTLDTPANLRRQAYEDVMRKNHKEPMTYEIPDVAYLNINMETIKRIFQDHPDVDGIFASDDLLAIKVMQYATSLGYSIPNDLKVVGYDGTDLIQTIYPELTTIVQPIAALAETALTVLEKQMQHENQPEKENVLPIQVKEGHTT